MLSEQLHKRFILVRPWFALTTTYAVSVLLAAICISFSAGPEATDYQAAFFVNSVALALLLVALLIARPKPKQPRSRTIYAAFEYLFVGFVFSLAVILLQHHGWHMSANAPSGFAAIAWGIAWIGVWLGPTVIGVLTLLLGHWLWLSIFIDYRSDCWQFIQEARTQALLEELLQVIQGDDFLRPKDAEYVGRKLIHWHSTAPWKPFELPLPSSGVHLHAVFHNDEQASAAEVVLQKLPAKGAQDVLQSVTLKWPSDPIASHASRRSIKNP